MESDADNAQVESTRDALAAKLQAALRDEVALVERAQHLEAERTALEEQVAALRDGQGEAVQRLVAQLAAGEAERSALRQEVLEQRAAKEEVKCCIYTHAMYQNKVSEPTLLFVQSTALAIVFTSQAPYV